MPTVIASAAKQSSGAATIGSLRRCAPRTDGEGASGAYSGSAFSIVMIPCGMPRSVLDLATISRTSARSARAS